MRLRWASTLSSARLCRTKLWETYENNTQHSIVDESQTSKVWDDDVERNCEISSAKKRFIEARRLNFILLNWKVYTLETENVDDEAWQEIRRNKILTLMTHFTDDFAHFFPN